MQYVSISHLLLPRAHVSPPYRQFRVHTLFQRIVLRPESCDVIITYQIQAEKILILTSVSLLDNSI